MKETKENTQNVKIILSRLKEAAGLTTDTSLAEALQVAPATLGNWKKRDTLDYPKIFTFCESVGLSLDRVIFGNEQLERNNFAHEPSAVFETQDKAQNIERLLIELLTEKVKKSFESEFQAMQRQINELSQSKMMPKIEKALGKLDEAIEQKTPKQKKG